MMPHLPYQRPATHPAALIQPAIVPSAHSSELHTELEELLSAVWQAEANWRFDDRLDMSLKVKRSPFRV